MERISLEKGVKILIEESKIKLGSELVSLVDTLGRVISEDAYALHNQPPFDRSPLDGYAVRGEDTTHASKDVPVVLEIIDEVCAGYVSKLELQEGQCIRIMTGGLMPKGSNGVIRQEDTDMGMDKVEITKGIKPYQNYCYAGEDYKAGEVLIKSGQFLTAYHIGLLASNGLTDVMVKRRLKVGVMTTGDELINPGETLDEGQIYNSNLYTTVARLKELGCEPVIIGSIHDDIEKGMELISSYASKVDMIITTGGVSVGKMDIMHPIYKGLDVRRLFWRLDLKPGTPALSGIYNDTLLLSLSGNPSAASITFELLFRPLLSSITNCENYGLKRIQATMQDAFLKTSSTRRFIKAHVLGGKVSMTKGIQSSGVLRSMIGCNGFIDLKPGLSINSGDIVDVILM